MPCTCSVILAEFESFRNYKGFSVISTGNLSYYESENVSDFSLHDIFEFENFRFPVLYEKKPSLGSKM